MGLPWIVQHRKPSPYAVHSVRQCVQQGIIVKAGLRPTVPQVKHLTQAPCPAETLPVSPMSVSAHLVYLVADHCKVRQPAGRRVTSAQSLVCLALLHHTGRTACLIACGHKKASRYSLSLSISLSRESHRFPNMLQEHPSKFQAITSVLISLFMCPFRACTATSFLCNSGSHFIFEILLVTKHMPLWANLSPICITSCGSPQAEAAARVA